MARLDKASPAARDAGRARHRNGRPPVDAGCPAFRAQQVAECRVFHPAIARRHQDVVAMVERSLR